MIGPQWVARFARSWLCGLFAVVVLGGFGLLGADLTLLLPVWSSWAVHVRVPTVAVSIRLGPSDFRRPGLQRRTLVARKPLNERC